MKETITIKDNSLLQGNLDLSKVERIGEYSSSSMAWATINEDHVSFVTLTPSPCPTWYMNFPVEIEFKDDVKLEDLLPNDKTFEDRIDNLTNSIKSLLVDKNKKYGNSVLEPLDIFKGKASAGINIDQKLSRIKASDKLVKNDVIDLIGYLLITCVENDWDSIDDLYN